MWKKNLVLLITLLNLSANSAVKKGVTIDVNLSPAGSFQITSRIKGNLRKKKGYLVSEKVTANVKSFKTGMDLRNKHTKEKMMYQSFPQVIVSNIKAINGKGTAFLKIRKIKRKIKFKYKKISKKYAKATFNISLKKFGFKGINFKGVGVEDIIKVEAILLIKNI